MLDVASLELSKSKSTLVGHGATRKYSAGITLDDPSQRKNMLEMDEQDKKDDQSVSGPNKSSEQSDLVNN